MDDRELYFSRFCVECGARLIYKWGENRYYGFSGSKVGSPFHPQTGERLFALKAMCPSGGISHTNDTAARNVPEKEKGDYDEIIKKLSTGDYKA